MLRNGQKIVNQGDQSVTANIPVTSLHEVIRDILQSGDGRNYYRERVKVYREHPKTKPAKKGSRRDALALRKLLVFRLKKYGATPAERALLTRIRGCKKGKRCVSAACPMCNYATQGVIAELIRDLLDVGIGLGKCITIIPAKRILAAADLVVATQKGKAIVETFRGKLDQAFASAGAEVIIGGIDFEFSEFLNGEFEDHFRPHLHALGLSTEIEASEAVLRKQFAAKGSVFKPVEIADYDGNDRWLRYLAKIPDTRKLRQKTMGPNGAEIWAPPRYKGLRKEQQLQQALLLDALGWAGRFYLRGLRLRRDRRGDWRLVRDGGQS